MAAGDLDEPAEAGELGHLLDACGDVSGERVAEDEAREPDFGGNFCEAEAFPLGEMGG